MVADELIMFGAGDRLLLYQRFDVTVEYGFFLICQLFELGEQFVDFGCRQFVAQSP